MSQSIALTWICMSQPLLANHFLNFIENTPLQFIGFKRIGFDLLMCLDCTCTGSLLQWSFKLSFDNFWPNRGRDDCLHLTACVSLCMSLHASMNSTAVRRQIGLAYLFSVSLGNRCLSASHRHKTLHKFISKFNKILLIKSWGSSNATFTFWHRHPCGRGNSAISDA